VCVCVSVLMYVCTRAYLCARVSIWVCRFMPVYNMCVPVSIWMCAGNRMTLYQCSCVSVWMYVGRSFYIISTHVPVWI